MEGGEPAEGRDAQYHVGHHRGLPAPTLYASGAHHELSISLHFQIAHAWVPGRFPRASSTEHPETPQGRKQCKCFHLGRGRCFRNGWNKGRISNVQEVTINTASPAPSQTTEWDCGGGLINLCPTTLSRWFCSKGKFENHWSTDPQTECKQPLIQLTTRIQNSSNSKCKWLQTPTQEPTGGLPLFPFPQRPCPTDPTHSNT